MTATFTTLFTTILLIPAVRAFSFSIDAAPSQCGSLTFSWDGGQGPYSILLVPTGHVNPEIRTIVDQQNINGNSWKLDNLMFPTGSSFVAMMSDSTGVGTGGTSLVYRVGSGSDSCMPTKPSQTEFYFYLGGSGVPSQCSDLSIGWDSKAANSISLIGMIPGGQSFDLGAPKSQTAFNWKANVPAGTVMMLVAGDSNGRGKGGSSDLMTVGGGDGGCINDNSPKSTPGNAVGQVKTANAPGPSSSNPPNPTPTPNPSNTASTNPSSNPSGSPNPSQSTTDKDGSPGGTVIGPEATGRGGSGDNVAQNRKTSNHIAAIVGGVLGGVAAVLLLAALLLLCRRRRNRTSETGTDAGSFAEDGALMSDRMSHTQDRGVPAWYRPEPFIPPLGTTGDVSNSSHGRPQSALDNNGPMSSAHGHSASVDSHYMGSPLYPNDGVEAQPWLAYNDEKKEPLPPAEQSGAEQPMSEKSAAAAVQPTSRYNPAAAAYYGADAAAAHDPRVTLNRRVSVDDYLDSANTTPGSELPPQYHSLRRKRMRQAGVV